MSNLLYFYHCRQPDIRAHQDFRHYKPYNHVNQNVLNLNYSIIFLRAQIDTYTLV